MDTETVPEAFSADHDLIAEIDRFASMVRGEKPAVTEAETLARITAFERLKATIVAAQSAEAVAFEALRQRRDALNQVPARDCGIRSAEEIALAKRVSPGSGRKFLSTSRAIVGEMPNTFKALAAGEISEDKARVMADETATLPSADRGKVDTRMKTSMGPAGLRSLRTEARALAEEMNAEAAAERAKKATANRRVTMTALDDGMGRVSAIIPIQQAVAVYEGLKNAAESASAAGGAKGRRNNQLLADTFVERLTGQSSAEAVPAEVHLVVEAESLLSDGLVPAWLPGFGPLPARTARNFIAANEAEVFIRRMFTRATDGQLVGMESRGRTFTGQLRQMVVFRDDVCRTPWCDARIRHADHADGHASGGETSWENGSGLCAACNYAKEHPGWKHKATAERLTVTTPTGREYVVPTSPLVRRMKYPRAAPGDGDWRLALSGLLEPQRSGSPPDSESDSECREVDIPFFPITASEAKKFEEQQQVESARGEPPEPARGEPPAYEIVEVVQPCALPTTLRSRYRRRRPRRARRLNGSGDRPVASCADSSKGSYAEGCLRQGLLDTG
ncbi:protein of unknown function [Brevibacterium sandarakinum]|uniref:HNH nuclease domain-containing protein n=1 Tax=Brevibacterium sandarakinum TaxID=629680 RepID=A0A1H1NEB5_BRESA|nr:DUF222 domain-containing protein [Brevibacterium sandarakinum]SDR97331.1 protein of unknown function [Brevibacterium sandarakinum]